MSTISNDTKQTLLNNYGDYSRLALEKKALATEFINSCALAVLCLALTILFSGLLGGYDSTSPDFLLRKKIAVMVAIGGCSLGGIGLLGTAYFFYKKHQFEHQKLTNTQVEAIRTNEKSYVDGAEREIAAIKSLNLEAAYSLVELSANMQEALKAQKVGHFESQTTQILKNRQDVMKICLATVAVFLLIAMVASIAISQEQNLSQDLIKGTWMATAIISGSPLLTSLGIFISTRIKSNWGEAEQQRMDSLLSYTQGGGQQIAKEATHQQMTRGVGNEGL